MRWGITVLRNGVIREYENSGDGYSKLQKVLEDILGSADGYVQVIIEMYEETKNEKED